MSSGALIQSNVAPVIRGSWIIFYIVPFLKSQQQLLLLTVAVGGGVNYLQKIPFCGNQPCHPQNIYLIFLIFNAR